MRLRVSGIVQGVFFRAATRDRARALGLKGWVRNLVDGRVELVAEGPAAAVDELVRFCRRGPRGAVVDRVDRVDETPRGDLPPFEVRR
ncbi:MAG: acylphosphatase [Candidatus Eiseniibacteriota bacterium]